MSAYSGIKPSGFVDAVTAPTGDAGSVFFGLFGASPAAADILGMDSVVLTAPEGDYAFSAPGGNYLWLAFPDTFTVPETFSYGGVDVAFAASTITLTIGGVDVDYLLYRSPEALNGDAVTITV